MALRYVVGVDDSHPGEVALAWALCRALSAPAPVILVHVADVDWGNMGSRYRGEAIRAADRLLDEIVRRARLDHPALDISGVRLEGSVPWALTRFVDPDDLLIVGTHKTGFLQGRVLGSGSVQIAATAPCTVAVIPDVDLRFRRGVVAGIDRDETAAAIAIAASTEAAGRQDDLLLIHSAARILDRSANDPPLTTAAAAARAAFPDLPIRSRISSRPPAEALLDTVRDRALLVVGPGTLSADRSPIGTVIHDVLMNANAPVMIIHRSAGRSSETAGLVESVEVVGAV